MDEIYHYRINPASGFGVHLIYTDDRRRDESFIVRNGDTVLIPEGYHPVCASPADSVYILWMLAGERRIFLSKPDENYRWVLRCEELIKK